MKKSYAFLLAVWILAGGPWLSVADAAGAEEPFGAEDPFSVLEGAQGMQVDSPAPQKTGRKPEVRAEVFFKGYEADISNASRINPGNRIQDLKEFTGSVETRMTVADYLNRQETVRWLFKGFAAGSNYHLADGTPRNKEARVDELFVDWKGDDLFVSIGKRRINWGHARGFNPVNAVAPPRDPINPNYQTEGRPMIWGSLRGAQGTVDVILTRNYDGNWNSDQNRWGLKWGGARGDTDYALYYFDGAPYPDGRAYERMAGASFTAVAAPGITLYMEAAGVERNYRNYYAPNGGIQRKSGGFFQGVIGSSLDMGGKSGLFVEYFFNGQGYSGDERINYLQTADARLGNGSDKTLMEDFTALAMNRSYILASLNKEFREKYTFALSVLMAGDSSSSTRAEVAYALSDYYEARMVYLYNAGGRDTEFGNSPYKGLFEIGIKASF